MNRDNFRILPLFARDAVPPMSRRMEKVLRQHIQDFAKLIAEGNLPGAAVEKMAGKMLDDFSNVQGGWSLAYAIHGFHLAGAWMGKRAFLLDIDSKAAIPVTTELSGADELVANHLRPHVAEWIEETSKYEVKTTALKYERLYRKGFGTLDKEDAATPAQLAKWIQRNGNGLTATQTRARMMARTITNWSYNEGATGLYEDQGLDKGEWMATLDDATGEWDEELHGTQIALRENFVKKGEWYQTSGGQIQTAGIDVPHPPLHPNCRCTIIPVV